MWKRTQIELDEPLAPAMERFRTEHAGGGQREDSAMFQHDDRRRTYVYLSPQASQWADTVFPDRAWTESARPPRSGTSLLIGSGNAMKRLLW